MGRVAAPYNGFTFALHCGLSPRPTVDPNPSAHGRPALRGACPSVGNANLCFLGYN
jgi:hypothetical protein